MAESNGGNGTFNLDAKERKLAFTSKDMVSVLLILMAGVGGYFVATLLTQNQRQALIDMQHNQAILVELVHTNRKEMAVEMKEQNTLLQQQTIALERKVDEQTNVITAKFEKSYHQHTMLNYNQHREINDQLPLDSLVPTQR